MRIPRDDSPTSSAPRSHAAALYGVGLAALAMFTAEIVLMPRLVALDGALWRAVLFARSCGTDEAVERALTVVTRLAMVLLAAAAAQSARQGGVRAAWPPLGMCAVGLLAGRVMKNLFMRERPSALPEVALGHSFPSGHIMNTTLAALAILVLAAQFRHRRRWWAAAAMLVALVTAGRLLLARHWLLDAIGSGLAACAVMGLCLPSFRRYPVVAPAGVALALAAMLAVDLHWRPLEIRLPSPLSERTLGLAEIEPALALGTSTLAGDWEPLVDERQSGAWLRGPGTITLALPEQDDWRSAGAARSRSDGIQLVLAGRPADDAPCAELRIALNGRALPAFVPFVGWREYRLPLPADTLRRGVNEVGIELADVQNRARFAILYLRVVADAQ